MVMAIYQYIERIWRTLVTPIFCITYTIMNKYYPGEPVHIYIYTIITTYYAGEKLGNYHQKRERAIPIYAAQLNQYKPNIPFAPKLAINQYSTMALSVNNFSEQLWPVSYANT